MKPLLTILTTTTMATVSGVNLFQLNNSKVNTINIDGKDYIGDKIYNIKFYDYINHNTFLKIEDIYLQNLPLKAIKQFNNLFKTFYKEKDLLFKEADYEKLSIVIYNNFSKIYMVNKQFIRGIKIEIGFNQADFLVTNVVKQ
ncbi:hypothetical protein [Spiroplasma ixodetis]|uniref:hypothetical protein n=1 Tax=Spiroplasma ixodetis TaxID=2141 RepID=UPI0025780BC0|nr:hypothetical protein [Spiroplasma ixodetis]WJG70226.1 hypothetical protein SIXOD_v1c13090 [Spiroplasma ixodetis Y32]